ncbi:hypothetical protein GN157_00275 [Flavobacterium rakeshii]|uniref:Zinc ribbon domain-containing protein n=1 Tax=Flavobacterium rakeshii TaxID=1038845 RepID=A0A6N8H775_9FLAO|nr:hypothetical protein [Flavobacterium rakeshii]MUV02132.1 hypothetical protein [Flavobacterium rakeshii]
MKPCLSCGNMLTQEASYCYVCNTNQAQGFEQFEIKPKKNNTFLVAMYVVVILILLFIFFG